MRRCLAHPERRHSPINMAVRHLFSTRCDPGWADERTQPSSKDGKLAGEVRIVSFFFFFETTFF